MENATYEEIIEVVERIIATDRLDLSVRTVIAVCYALGYLRARDAEQRHEAEDGAGDFSGFRALIHQALEQFEKYRRR